MKKVNIINLGEPFQVVDDHPEYGFSSGILRVIDINDILGGMELPENSFKDIARIEEVQTDVIESIIGDVKSPWNVHWVTDPADIEDPYILIEQCAMMGFELVIIDIHTPEAIFSKEETQFDSGPYLH